MWCLRDTLKIEGMNGDSFLTLFLLEAFHIFRFHMLFCSREIYWRSSIFSALLKGPDSRLLNTRDYCSAILCGPHFSIQILGKWEWSVHLNAIKCHYHRAEDKSNDLGAGDQELILYPGTCCLHKFEQVPFLKDAFWWLTLQQLLGLK